MGHQKNYRTVCNKQITLYFRVEATKVRSKYVETTPELWYGVLQHTIFIDDTDMMTKVNSLIDTLKCIPIYADMTLNACELEIEGKIRNWAPSQYKDRLIYVWQFPC